MSNAEKNQSLKKANTLQPGDLIVTRTPSSIYEALRRIGES